MAGSGSKLKAQRWEEEVLGLFAGVFGRDKVRRGMHYLDGAKCADIITPMFWSEARAGKRTNARAALQRATEGSKGKGMYPIAVCKDDGDEAFVTVSLADFLDLVREWWELRTQ